MANVFRSLGRTSVAGLLVSVALASTASAALIAYDGFNYADGTNLSVVIDGANTSHDFEVPSALR